MSTKILADKHSAKCFLNSLFREWSDYSYDKNESEFVVNLVDGASLHIPVSYYSLVGRHSYGSEFYFQKDNTKEEVSFTQLSSILLNHLSLSYKTDASQLETFKDRIADSIHNIELSLDIREQDLAHLYEQDEMDFIQAEQALIIGHTFHPHPKNRDEFEGYDYKKYSPEARGEFHLEWLLVDPSIVHSHISDNFEQKNWQREIFEKENPNESFKANMIAYPVHPWQKKVIMSLPIIKEYVVQGLIIEAGESKDASSTWHPTSSLRSIYNKTSPYMLKFSLSVRLTNSIRHLLPLEVVRGLQVQDVFSTAKGKEFLKEFPDFNILFEPAFMAIKDLDGKILNETIVALRINSFFKNSSQKLVVATLTQDHPVEGMSLIGNFIQKQSVVKNINSSIVAQQWFSKYLKIAVKPLMMAQANYGVMLGAHQQNLLIEIKDNMPVAAYFRDCQGTGYSRQGFALFAKEVDLITADNGNVLDETVGNYLFSYYLIINSTFNVLSSIAQDSGTAEESLMAILRESLLQWKNEGVKDDSCFNYLLNDKELMQKGNFLCSFINMNENTTDNPLGIYNSIPNPIFEAKLC